MTKLLRIGIAVLLFTSLTGCADWMGGTGGNTTTTTTTKGTTAPTTADTTMGSSTTSGVSDTGTSGTSK